MFAAMTKDDPEKGAKAYLEQFYYGPKTWADYLSRLGMVALLDASQRGWSIRND